MKMKKLLIGLMFLSSVSASANCNFDISFTAPLVFYSQKKIVRMIKNVLGKKGYTFVENAPSQRLDFLVTECQDDCSRPDRRARIFLENQNGDGTVYLYSSHSFPLFSPLKKQIIKKMLVGFPKCQKEELL